MRLHRSPRRRGRLLAPERDRALLAARGREVQDARADRIRRRAAAECDGEGAEGRAHASPRSGSRRGVTDRAADDLRQILALLAEYGATLDEGRWQDHRELWTETAELCVFGRTLRGRDAIEEFMRKAVRGKHLTAAPRLEIDG